MDTVNLTEKFVTVGNLGRFLENVQTYVADADAVVQGNVDAVAATVGDETAGLVKDVADLRAELNALGDVEGGQGIGGMIDAKIAGLDVTDAEVAGEYVASVSETDGKITVTRKALPVYETSGAAATAEANAKAYVDGIVGDVTGEDGTVTKGLNSRIAVLEAIDHDQLAAEAAATAVAGVIDDAPEKFDTLKEIAAWIAEADTAEDAASLVTRVSTLEAIDHDAYVGADATNLQAAKDYADGLITNLPMATNDDIDALFA